MQVVSEEITSACRWRRRRGLTQVSFACRAGLIERADETAVVSSCRPWWRTRKRGRQTVCKWDELFLSSLLWLILLVLWTVSEPSESPLLLVEGFWFSTLLKLCSLLFLLLKVSYSSRKLFLYWGESLRRLLYCLRNARESVCWQVCRRDNFFSGELWSFVRD